MPYVRSEKSRPSGDGTILQRGLGNWVWVVFALIGLLPALTLVRIGVVLHGAERLSAVQSGELIVLTGFSLFSLLVGLYLLVILAGRLRDLHRQSEAVKAAASGADADESREDREPLVPEVLATPEGQEDSVTDVLGSIRAGLDQTLTRLTEQAQHLEYLEQVLECCSDMVIMVDERNSITFCNRAAQMQLGLRSDRNLRRALAEGVLGKQDWQELADRLEAWEDQEEKLSLNEAPNGPLAVQLTVTLVRTDSDSRVKFVIMRDISERMRLERQIYHSERLASLGQLISGVAHELNNPLAAILGFAELSRETETADEELKDNLATIETEARRTARIVEDLLNFTRQRNETRDRADIHELLERCFTLLAYQFRSANVEVVRRYAEDLPAIVIDAYQMQQVFMNIIINAAQAMKTAGTEDPRITVTTRYRSEDRSVVVDICDSGPGIPQEQTAQVFEPFFTTKSGDDGTGLGLPVSLAIVRDHGGNIAVRSRRGSGACFSILLPADADVEAINAPLPSTQPQERRGIRLNGRALVIDDEPSVAAMVRQMLENTGLQVSTAETLSEALGLLKTNDFDVIVADVRMPDGDGTDVRRFLLDNRPARADALLFVSGDPQVVSRLRRTYEEQVPVLLKPFHVDDLYEQIESVLKKSRQIPG